MSRHLYSPLSTEAMLDLAIEAWQGVEGVTHLTVMPDNRLAAVMRQRFTQTYAIYYAMTVSGYAYSWNYETHKQAYRALQDWYNHYADMPTPLGYISTQCNVKG